MTGKSGSSAVPVNYFNDIRYANHQVTKQHYYSCQCALCAEKQTAES
jgi:hypothetical protein